MYTSKDKVRVVVITGDFRIEGDLHILSGSRLTDAVNSKTKDFFALTDAVVFRAIDDQVLHRPSYLAINRETIAAIFPVEE